MIEKLVSGGQTGADNAALDVALHHNFSHGGWGPKGRLSLDGAIPAQYLLFGAQHKDQDLLAGELNACPQKI